MDAGEISIYEAAEKGDYELVKWIVEYSRSSLNEFAQGHRTALHFAAMSGHPDMFEYLTDRCGLDPLQGDTDLITPWDIVHERIATLESKNRDGLDDLEIQLQNYRKIESFLERKYGHKYEDYYRNPIRTGFFPDPSICRVGDDYYMVNSSFIFFPCIPISHSRDLVHWEIIGHAITDPKWARLDELEGGRGYWAPDITYYEGRFYITATYRLNDIPPVYRRQIVVSADKPEGPYSEPVFIDEDGIDPGFFNDDDGRRYMLLNRGARIFELDKTATRKISDAKLLYQGSNKRAPEGPHIYKKDGYYYLLQAEGGTGPGHRVTVSRSRDLMGVYEPCPYNPIMRQEDAGATIQRCGHGDMVETSDGRWYMVYLCGRKIGDGYSILGRETALDPVTWTADGWPIVNGLKGPSCMQVKPHEDHIPEPLNRISPCGLPLEYMTCRSFEKGEIVFDSEDVSFTIKSSMLPLSDKSCKNLVLRRQTSFDCDFKARLSIPQLQIGQTFGVTGYYDENTFLEYGIRNIDDKLYIYCSEHIGDEDKYIYSDEPLPDDIKEIILNIETIGLKRNLYYDIGNGQCLFKALDNVYYLCDEGLSKGKRFTGALLGMYAFSGEKSSFTAKFSDVQYREK